MKHTDASKKLHYEHGMSEEKKHNPFGGTLNFSTYAAESCAFASTYLYGFSEASYKEILRYVEAYRKPVLFSLRSSVLSKESLKKTQKEGKYGALRFVTETEGWHGTPSVSLFIAELNDEIST